MQRRLLVGVAVDVGVVVVAAAVDDGVVAVAGGNESLSLCAVLYGLRGGGSDRVAAGYNDDLVDQMDFRR